LDSAHKSGDAWVRIASSVQAWIVLRWEDPQRLEPILTPVCLISINAPPAETARWKRCLPRLAPINVWISKGFYSHRLRLITVGEHAGQDFEALIDSSKIFPDDVSIQAPAIRLTDESKMINQTFHSNR
jgi:hypothetical protein